MMLTHQGGDRGMSSSKFSKAFVLSLDVHAAIRALVSEAADSMLPIDPNAVLHRILADHPETDHVPAELAETIVHAAAKAGVPLLVREIDQVSYCKA